RRGQVRVSSGKVDQRGAIPSEQPPRVRAQGGPRSATRSRRATAVQDFGPFTFSRDGDKLRGRGTTDCLGHVALVTELMRQLAVCRPELGATVVAVLIANEENATVKDIGVDGLVKAGLLDHLRNGPLFWVDTADKQPCIGTGGMLAWKLKAFGKLFHSGLPHKAINPIELAMTALAEMQTRFYRDFPPHAMEKTYGFATPSTMKPTQWSYPGGSVNQIPGECTVAGDCRITPFYDEAEGVCCRYQRQPEHALRPRAVLEIRSARRKSAGQ
ncbi:unnamed protein product, partial [Closterium sp. Naga37s-1]